MAALGLSMKLFLLFLTVILPLSTTTNASLPIRCGYGVMNLHEKNNDLIGYAIQQEPTPKDHRNYNGSHPYIVVFLFKKYRAHVMFYSPSGQALGGQWEQLTTKHWAVANMKPISDLHRECRGNNLQ